MALVTTKEMFKKAYEGHYAIGAFNVNNMEIVQGITEAAGELNSPIILQVSAGARKYAQHEYLVHLVKAALELNDIPIALHLDHGADFEIFLCSDFLLILQNHSQLLRRNTRFLGNKNLFDPIVFHIFL